MLLPKVVPYLGQVWTLSTNALEDPFPSAKTMFYKFSALFPGKRERSLQKQGNTPVHILPTHSTPVWLFAENAVFHFFKAKILISFPSIVPDPLHIHHKDPLILHRSLLGGSSKWE